MLAALHDRYGKPDVVALRQIERPVPVADQVLVQVRGASVNRADLDTLIPHPRFLRLFLGIRRPRIPAMGSDVAGIVTAVGPDVTRFAPGDRVFADLYPFGQGSFAEYVRAPERAFLPIPDGMSVEDAATLPHSAILAIQSLRRRDGRSIQPGDRVLIDGASGNVGPFAVQIAKAFGAEVTGVASTTKLDLVRSLGADHVIDYTTTDYTSTGQRYDWIVATESHHSPLRIRHALARGGRYVTLGGTTRQMVESLFVAPVVGLATGSRLGLMLWWKPFHRDDVTALADLYAAGRLRPAIERTYPLTDVVAALRHVDDRRARGKVVIVMPERAEQPA
jgi:NADPH:quinone reductase-like Zn-dependent oxidoreductase